MKKILVTTSWDDGHILDKRIARLLFKYGLKGTFYVSPRNREFSKESLLSDKDIINLSKYFEIGAHTFTHPDLTEICTDEARKEISESKNYLEKLTGKKIRSFCYPKGRYTPEIRDIISEIGFSYARTVKRFNFRKSSDDLQSATGVDCYKHYQDIFKLLMFSDWKISVFLRNMDWENFAKSAFDKLKGGHIYHLWGHSWIIDKRNEWRKLERLLKYISRKPNAIYLENNELSR